MFVFPSPVFFRYAIFFAESLSLLANSLVIRLALTETNKDLVEYRSILVVNCLIDYTCTFVNIINQPHIEFLDDLWVQVFEGPSKFLPHNILVMVSGSHSFMIGLGIIALPIQFAYRWFLIKTGRRLTNMQLAGLVFVTFLGAGYFWCNLSACFYFSDWNFKDRSFLRKDPYIYSNYNPNPVFLIGELKSGIMLLHTTMACLTTLIVGILVWYFSFNTYLILQQSKDSMHENTKRLQYQMNRMLLVQTTAVFVSVIIPVCLHLTMMVFDLKIYGLGTFINLIISFMPTLNPICTLLLVSRLRNRALRMVCFGKQGQISADLSTSITA